MIECVVVDVDGTLTDERGVIHHRVVAALEKLRQRGVHVILSSGNCYPVLVGLAYYLPVTRLVIAENGGVVGFKNEYEILGDPLKAKRAREALVGQGVLVDSWQNPFRFVDLAFHPASGFTLEEAVKEARRLVRGMGVIVESSGWAVHVRDETVDKGRGLLVACRRLGVDPSAVAAIGDSDVDAAMFEVAGFSIALGNATDHLKDEADVVVKGEYWLGFLEAVEILMGKA